MNIKGFSWFGIRTDDIVSTLAFFTNVLGLPITRQNDDHRFVTLKFPSGQELEIFWNGNQYYDLHPHPVVAFDVPDIEAARAELESRGVAFLTEIKTASSPSIGPEYKWCYFKDPNDNIYELYQHPEI